MSSLVCVRFWLLAVTAGLIIGFFQEDKGSLAKVAFVVALIIMGGLLIFSFFPAFTL